MTKQLIIFKKHTWTQIPHQDNPAYDFISNTKHRREECIMIIRYDTLMITKYAVIEVPVIGSVVYRGYFPELFDAELFGNLLIEEDE